MLSVKKMVGIGLLELMLALSIIAVLLLTATRYYTVTRDSQRIDETVQMVLAIAQAGQTYLQNTGSFLTANPNQPPGPDLSVLLTFVQNGLLPAQFEQANANPWQGTVSITADSSTSLQIIFAQMPQTACYNLTDKLAEKLPPNFAVLNCIGSDNNSYPLILDFSRLAS